MSVFAGTPSAITDTTTRVGWTVGGGMEAMLWARGEYRYADIGTWSPTDARLSPGVGSTFAVTDAIRIRTQTATAGVGYKF